MKIIETIDWSIKNWKVVFVRERNRFLAGRGEIAVVGTLLTYFAMGTVWLKMFFPDNEIIQVVFSVSLAVFFIFGSWLIGYWFDKTKIFHAMNQFVNERDLKYDKIVETLLAVEKIQKDILEIKQKLELKKEN